MKANEFVKKHGWSAVTNAVKSTTAEETAAFESRDLDQTLAKDGGVAGFNVRVYRIPYGDVKRLVESHELVEKYKNKHGGIRFRIRWGMYRYGDTQQFNDRLKQAIADVESCQ